MFTKLSQSEKGLKLQNSSVKNVYRKINYLECVKKWPKNAHSGRNIHTYLYSLEPAFSFFQFKFLGKEGLKVYSTNHIHFYRWKDALKIKKDKILMLKNPQQRKIKIRVNVITIAVY